MNEKCKKIEFLCNSEDRREHIKAPWTYKGHTYTTNGVVLLRIRGEYAEEINSNNIKQSIDSFRLDEFENLSERFVVGSDSIPEPKPCPFCTEGEAIEAECPECEGEGTVECSECGSEIECKDCEGTGKIIKKYSQDDCPHCDSMGYDDTDRIEIQSRRLSTARLKWLHDNLGDFILYPESRPCEDGVAFTFDGGVGLLMECRK